MNARIDALAESQFQDALALHQQSRLDEAAAAYRRVLERQPRHAHALNFLAAIAFQGDDFAGAVSLTGRALGIDPELVGAHLLHGHALVQMARWDDAIASYQRAIALQPDLPPAHLALGNVFAQLGRHRDAVRSFDELLARNPTLVEALNNRGNSLRSLRCHEAALRDYERAIELAPQLPEPHFNRGLGLHALRRLKEAGASFDRAIGLRPGYAQAHYARGNALKDARRFAAALASYDAAIAAHAGYAEAYCNRGNVLSGLERFEEAFASYRSALALAPQRADTHCNLGTLLHELGRYEEALTCLDRAVSLEPDHAAARLSRAFVHLVSGDLSLGFRDFEWRWENEHCITSREKRMFARPQWQGLECVAGRTVFVYCEQGLGDTLQFCRYIPLLAARGARVIFEVPHPLLRLLQDLAGAAQCIVRGSDQRSDAVGSGEVPTFDYHCPLLSLPSAFGTTLDSIPAAVPYLRASPERLRHWRDLLGESTRLRVGLVWSGGFRADQPELWGVNERRNIPLGTLAVLKHPGVEFFSLQRGQPAEDELPALLARGWDGPPITDFTGRLSDFAETAALIEQLDLVISVDTSTAHLAAALGRPVWLLNRFDTCWRWLKDRNDSPWYPTLTLYRQPRRGDWDDVLRRVRRDLAALVERSSAHEPARSAVPACVEVP